MELEASRLLPAPREAVWAALNDPETLRRCIPGCDALERGEDGSLAAKVVAKVGPVSAKFAGTVSLHDLVPPESYRLAFQGQGGAAGFAKGEAWVRLEAMPDGATTMHYRSKASVGGKLAQVGARLIDASARKLADDFFERFAKEVSAVPAAPQAAPAQALPPAAPAAGAAGVPSAAASASVPSAAASASAAAAAAASASAASASAAAPPAAAAPAGGSRTAWIVAAVVAAALLAWWLA
jgi:carbon monoxide dehydrogenase subunit G